MRRKKGEGEMMQEAIDKATQLIQLLQRENRDLKKRVDLFEKECTEIKRENGDLLSQNQEIIKKYSSHEEKLAKTLKQLEDNREAFNSMEESLKKRMNINKQLHEKVSLLNAKLKEKSRDCIQEKTKLLSLENQNEYLLKRLEQSSDKENGMTQKMSRHQDNRQQQLREAIRLKEAFSRRCEQLKTQNQALIAAAAEYKQQAIDNSLNRTTEIRPRIRHVSRQQIVKIQAPPVQNVDSFLTRLITNKLGINPLQTAQQQYDQISSFIEYRLSHLQKLCKSIFSKLESSQWTKIQNLKDLYTSCQRIYVYIGELVNKSS